jgi:transcriptional regulator with GAF, ATPase, and Fis domain
MSPKLQVKLLRVLQEREFEPVGSDKPVRVEVRVIAATNRDLLTAVKERRFREDLFYRLNVLPIHLPPLRERLGDIALLIDHFLRLHSCKKGLPSVRIEADVLERLNGNGGRASARSRKLDRTTCYSDVMEASLGHATCPTMYDVEPIANQEQASLRDLRLPPKASTSNDSCRRLKTSGFLQALSSTGGNKTLAAELLTTESYDVNRAYAEKGSRLSTTPLLP